MLIMGLILAGTLVVVGTASAATADELQPAGDSMNVSSLRVGSAGEGGVTFFNGSIINEAGALTIADDVRIDGVIFRTEVGGDNPVKIADSVIPTVDSGFDSLYQDNNGGYMLGSEVYRWRDVYAQWGDFSNDLTVGGGHGGLTSGNGATIMDNGDIFTNGGVGVSMHNIDVGYAWALSVSNDGDTTFRVTNEGQTDIYGPAYVHNSLSVTNSVSANNVTASSSVDTPVLDVTSYIENSTGSTIDLLMLLRFQLVLLSHLLVILLIEVPFILILQHLNLEVVLV